MPMLYTFRNFDNSAFGEQYCRLPPLLIPTAAIYAYKHLHFAMMDVPIIAATWFKRDIDNVSVIRCEITSAGKILRIGRVRSATAPIRFQIDVISYEQFVGHDVVGRIVDA